MFYSVDTNIYLKEEKKETIVAVSYFSVSVFYENKFEYKRKYVNLYL